MTKRRNAFTLVELLVVIGIIALLIAILLPALNNARESANRTKCLSNVRQMAIAIVMYCNDNKGRFPMLRGTGTGSEIIHWELDNAAGTPSPGSTLVSGGQYDKAIATEGIGPYLGIKTNNVNMMRCPSDTTFATRMGYAGNYTFSYSVNWSFNGAPFKGDNPVADANGWYVDPNAPDPCRQMTQVVSPSEKILVVEEDERTVDDCQCSLTEYRQFWGDGNRLAIRHDLKYHNHPDPISIGYPSPTPWMPNANGKGNVGFCDGHAQYVPRSYAHVFAHGVKDISDMAAYLPDIPMHVDGP